MQEHLLKLNNICTFSLVEPFSDDIWDITNWSIYKDADTSQQIAFNARTSVMHNSLDFTLCKSRSLREEVKYFTYRLIAKGISLRSLAEYIDRFKLLFQYAYDNNISFVSEIDIESYKQYLTDTKHKVTINDGTTVRGKAAVVQTRKNRNITFISNIQKCIEEYFSLNTPMKERDYWKGSELHPDELTPANINFADIMQPLMKQATKNYIWFRQAHTVTKTCQKDTLTIKRFCHWLSEYDEKILSFASLNRDIIEEYFYFLRIESGFSQHMINTDILKIGNFLKWGSINGDTNFPNKVLVLSNDYAFKTVKAPDFYSEREIARIYDVAKTLPKIYGRIILILHHCGMRISELLWLRQDAIKEIGGKHYISIYMYKTARYNNIPLSDFAYNIIANEIVLDKKKYPNSHYVFLNSQGNPVNYSHFIQTIKLAIINNNVLGDDGCLLKFKTHKFRSTKATILINMGEDPNVVAQILGQKSLDSLGYYVAAQETAMQDEMKYYIKKQSALINAIGKMDSLAIENIAEAIPLCNGYCCRPSTLGICEKVNACIECSLFKPSIRFILNYQMQLTEAESTLLIAKENNYTRLTQKCESEIKALKSILDRLEVFDNE